MRDNDLQFTEPGRPSEPTVGSSDRRVFLRSATAATGLIVGGAALVKADTQILRKPSRKPAAGVTESKTKHPVTPTLPNLYPNWNARQFAQIQSDENAHVKILLQALGANARPAPTFTNLEQPDVFTFAKVSYLLENTGVAAYLAAAPVINSKAYLAAAGSILGIEARHSGYLGVLLNGVMDDFSPVDLPGTIPIVLTNAAPFLQAGSSLNGGPPLSFDATPSDANDISILNFALALEFLESDFYNINVPKFFPGF